MNVERAQRTGRPPTLETEPVRDWVRAQNGQKINAKLIVVLGTTTYGVCRGAAVIVCCEQNMTAFVFFIQFFLFFWFFLHFSFILITKTKFCTHKGTKSRGEFFPHQRVAFEKLAVSLGLDSCNKSDSTESTYRWKFFMFLVLLWTEEFFHLSQNGLIPGSCDASASSSCLLSAMYIGRRFRLTYINW